MSQRVCKRCSNAPSLENGRFGADDNDTTVTDIGAMAAIARGEVGRSAQVGCEGWFTPEGAIEAAGRE